MRFACGYRYAVNLPALSGRSTDGSANYGEIGSISHEKADPPENQFEDGDDWNGADTEPCEVRLRGEDRDPGAYSHTGER